MTSRSRLLQAAACIEANPTLFDAITWETARAALIFCRRCPVTDICERHVLTSRPSRSGYDGVAGGRVWRDGSPVPRPKQWRISVDRPTCGTRDGRIAHLEFEEHYCPPCAATVPRPMVQLTLTIGDE